VSGLPERRERLRDGHGGEQSPELSHRNLLVFDQLTENKKGHQGSHTYLRNNNSPNKTTVTICT
jgi:hypothetical protein